MNRSRFFLLFATAGLVAVAGLIAQNSPAVSDTPSVVTVGTGFDYSRGDYGLATDTEVLSVPLNLSYEKGSWLFDARVPWMRIVGPAAVVAGGGSSPRPTAAAESGLGDITLGATWRSQHGPDATNFAATVRTKLPTASEERGLGTGEADYSGQIDLYRNFGRVTPFASVGYTAFGDSALYQLEDGAYVSGGAHLRTGPSTVVTAAYNWRHRFIAGGDPGSDALLAVTHDLSPRWRVMGYATKGFSNASPDSGGGLQLSRRF